MRWNLCIVIAALGLLVGSGAWALSLAAMAGGAPGAQAAEEEDPAADMVGRLNLDSYKETLRGLAQFGERARIGTGRRSIGSRNNSKALVARPTGSSTNTTRRPGRVAAVALHRIP